MHQNCKDSLVARLGSHHGAHQSHGFEVLELSLQTDEKKARAPERPNFHFTSTSASKAEVLERLSERGREQHERFATCDVCRRLFWEGSHWRRMRTLLAPVMGREI
jgi:uncharacterized protein with PIN domain